MAVMHDRIRELRSRAGMTLAKIAEYLGTTEATAQRYESGKGIKNIPYEVIEKYASIFGCTPQFIVGWEEEKNSSKVYTTNHTTIGKKIKQRRQELDWTLRDLADRMGYKNHSSIVRIENDEIDLPASKLEAFADVLGVDVGYLLSLDDEKSESDVDMMNHIAIGQRIKTRRKEMKISVDELSALLGKNRATIYRYEKGEIENLPLDILEPMARALDTTPAYLMGWDEDEKKPVGHDGLSEKRKAIIDFAKSVPEDQIDYILRVMKTILEAD